MELRDISIIGGGPTGLFAAFYAGMRGASAPIIDALQRWVGSSWRSGEVHLQFGATTHLGEIVTGLRRVEGDGIGHFVLRRRRATIPPGRS